MDIYGLQKMTLLDFPGRVACTVFLAGCGLRCPYCHNAELVGAAVPPLLDDGPLPEVYADAYQGAAAMRNIVRSATTVICLATMLHTIATGNMTPSFRVLPGGTVRPVYLYAVDAEEFVVNKLRDRGSLSATTMVTNVQDFITKVARDLGVQP